MSNVYNGGLVIVKLTDVEHKKSIKMNFLK